MRQEPEAPKDTVMNRNELDTRHKARENSNKLTTAGTIGVDLAAVIAGAIEVVSTLRVGVGTASGQVEGS